MKNALSVLLLFSFFYSTNLSAKSIIEKYEKETIYLSGNKFVKGGERYPLGLFYGNLEKEMEVSPAAQLGWSNSKKNKNGFLVSYTVGLASLITGIIIREENETAGNVLVGGGFAATLVALPLSVNMQKTAHKAVWLRNRDVLK